LPWEDYWILFFFKDIGRYSHNRNVGITHPRTPPFASTTHNEEEEKENTPRNWSLTREGKKKEDKPRNRKQ
jgi:hypothetical protein